MIVEILRFSGFDETWVKSNLGNVSSDEMYGMNSAATDFDGFNKYIRITDISESSNKFVPSPLTSPDGNLDEKFKLKEGDIVFARTGASTGKTYIYDKNDGNLYFAGFLIKFNINKAYPKFVFYNTLKDEYKNWVSVMSVRSGQPGINSNEYKKLPLNIPSLDEQKKISDFLESIDSKIDLLKKKYEYYQEFKKYLMQQIFAGKLRFEEDSEWKTVKLGDICNIKTGKLDANAMVENGKYRFYTCAKEYYFIDEYAYDTEALLISGNGAHVGYIHYYNGKFNAYQRTYILDKFTEDIKLIMYILDKNLKKRIQQEKNEGSTPYIKLSTLKDMKIDIPQSKTEQEKITSLFTNVNNKIDNVSEELKNMQNFKKGLLQQMFVCFRIFFLISVRKSVA